MLTSPRLVVFAGLPGAGKLAIGGRLQPARPALADEGLQQRHVHSVVWGEESAPTTTPRVMRAAGRVVMLHCVRVDGWSVSRSERRRPGPYPRSNPGSRVERPHRRLRIPPPTRTARLARNVDVGTDVRDRTDRVQPPRDRGDVRSRHLVRERPDADRAAPSRRAGTPSYRPNRPVIIDDTHSGRLLSVGGLRLPSAYGHLCMPNMWNVRERNLRRVRRSARERHHPAR